MAGVFIRGDHGIWRDTQAVPSQIKDHKKWQQNGAHWQAKARGLKGDQAAGTLTLDFWPPEPQDNKPLYSKAPSLVFCYESPSNIIQQSTQHWRSKTKSEDWLLDFKTCSEVTAMKTVWYWWRNGQIDQWDKIALKLINTDRVNGSLTKEQR